MAVLFSGWMKVFSSLERQTDGQTDRQRQTGEEDTETQGRERDRQADSRQTERQRQTGEEDTKRQGRGRDRGTERMRHRETD